MGLLTRFIILTFLSLSLKLFATEEFVPVCDRSSAFADQISFEAKKKCEDTNKEDLLKIKVLILNVREIQTFKATDLSGLTNLIELNLNTNKIHKIDSDHFDFVPNLQTLSLSHNRVREIHPNAFAKLKFLKKLNLSISPHLILTSKHFENNPLLEDLNLRAYFRLKDFGVRFLKGLKNLKRLELTNSRINDDQLKDLLQLLSHSNSIEDLNLEDNKIQNLNPSSMSRLTKLKTLNLAENNINKIMENSLSMFPNLTILRLNNNFLSQIHPLAFQMNSLIENLDLGWNTLTSDRVYRLWPLTQLTELTLTGNHIKYVNSMMFRNFSKLEHLDLDANKFSEIPSDLFVYTPRLKKVLLGNEHLVKIPLGCFEDLKFITAVGVLGSPLTQTQKGAFKGVKSVFGLPENFLMDSDTSNSQGWERVD